MMRTGATTESDSKSRFCWPQTASWRLRGLVPSRGLFGFFWKVKIGFSASSAGTSTTSQIRAPVPAIFFTTARSSSSKVGSGIS